MEQLKANHFFYFFAADADFCPSDLPRIHHSDFGLILACFWRIWKQTGPKLKCATLGPRPRSTSWAALKENTAVNHHDSSLQLRSFNVESVRLWPTHSTRSITMKTAIYNYLWLEYRHRSLSPNFAINTLPKTEATHMEASTNKLNGPMLKEWSIKIPLFHAGLKEPDILRKAFLAALLFPPTNAVIFFFSMSSNNSLPKFCVICLVLSAFAKGFLLHCPLSGPQYNNWSFSAPFHFSAYGFLLCYYLNIFAKSDHFPLRRHNVHWNSWFIAWLHFHYICAHLAIDLQWNFATKTHTSSFRKLCIPHKRVLMLWTYENAQSEEIRHYVFTFEQFSPLQIDMLLYDMNN